MAKLVIVRNCQTDWNKIKRIQGTVDVPLNDEGKAIAERIASELSVEKITAVYSSGLQRSYQTAEIIGQPHKIKPKKVQDLNELNQGVWQGLCQSEIKKRYKKQYSLWRNSPFSTKPPQGESMKDAYDRVVNATQKIIEKHGDDVVCVVAHEVVISLIKCHFTQQDINNMWKTTPGIGVWEALEV